MKPTLTAHLLGPLHEELMGVLRPVSETEWGALTLASEWSVRDVAAHVLDGYLKTLSVFRDGFLPPMEQRMDYATLVDLINRQNRQWVEVARRFSPGTLVDLLATAGPAAARTLQSLPPDEPAVFAVAWAGESQSTNWMHVGREYAEQWHHQAQIRDALDRPGLLERRWFEPLMDIAVRALPNAYRDRRASPGTALVVRISGDEAGPWTLVREEAGWWLGRGAHSDPDAAVELSPELAWRTLFNASSTGRTRAEARIEGDTDLVDLFFTARSVMV